LPSASMTEATDEFAMPSGRGVCTFNQKGGRAARPSFGSPEAT
jgi:hypothetical protein